MIPARSLITRGIGYGAPAMAHFGIWMHDESVPESEPGRRDLRKKRRAEIERMAITARRRREAEFFMVGM
jgi:hypothetical protein